MYIHDLVFWGGGGGKYPKYDNFEEKSYLGVWTMHSWQNYSQVIPLGSSTFILQKMTQTLSEIALTLLYKVSLGSQQSNR